MTRDWLHLESMLKRLEFQIRNLSLEKDFPEGLIWDMCFVRETGQQVARIYVEKGGIDFHRREDWGEFFSFMARQMYLLERNFMKIAEYLRE